MRSLILTLITCALALPAQAQYSGGSGTAENPYQVATAADLIALGETPDDYDKHFILTADIDLDPNLPGRKVFERAVIAPDFAGVFDGSGHTIRNLEIGGTSRLGLFGLIQANATVCNLGVVEVSVVSTGADSENAAGLAGVNYGNVLNCYSSGIVSGEDDNIGGLIGRSYGRVYGCFSMCKVSGDDDVGGLLGQNSGIVASCYVGGRVSGDNDVGGFVGQNDGRIERSYSVGAVSGDVSIGGFVGQNEGRILGCFWDLQSSGQAFGPGGSGTGLTTNQMMDSEMYGLNGWANDPNWVLDVGNDYPRLAWEGRVGGPIAESAVDWISGNGTVEEPYQITDANELTSIARATILWNRHFELSSDIDLSDLTWTDAVIPMFEGTFRGNGFTIRHLTVSGGDHLGLFGEIREGAFVQDLGVADVNIAGADNLGGLVGENRGHIVNCHSRGLVSGRDSVAGLVGYNAGSIAASCSNMTIDGDDDVGGLVGTNDGAVTSCYGNGTVSGDNNIGGCVGQNNGDISRCYCVGPVTGDERVGGFAGRNEGHILDSFWDTEVSRQMFGRGAIGLPTDRMKEPTIYGLNGWADDPNWVLDVGNDYPRLAWEDTPGLPIPEPSMHWISGNGTADAPYEITDANQLFLIGEAGVLSGEHFKLGADIDLFGFVLPRAFIPEFSGIFNGNGFVITGLEVRGEDDVGLFGTITSEGHVSNLGVVYANVISTGDECENVGGLVGRNNGHVTDCFGIACVAGEDDSIGALVGRNYGWVKDCYSSGAVSGDDDVGGLVGENDGSITGSYSNAIVSGDNDLGGLVGQNNGQVASCYSTGQVAGDETVGGFVGQNNGTIVNSFSLGAVSGRRSVGGFIGFSDDFISSSFWNVDTSGWGWSIDGEGLSTEVMRDSHVYVLSGWDNDPNWLIRENDYPRLAWEEDASQSIPGPALHWISGRGTEEDPYEITDANQLLLIGDNVFLKDKYCVLRRDIDFDGITLDQAVIPNFAGVFDGNGLLVRNLVLRGHGNLGLFGVLERGSIVRDIGVVEVNVSAEADRAGVLAGMNSGLITGCFTHGYVAAANTAGGLVGENYATIEYCYSTGSVTSDRIAGGLVGKNNSIVSQCYSAAAVSGEETPGGLSGVNNGVVSRSLWDIETSGQSSSQGGVGLTTAEMTDPQMYALNGWAGDVHWVLDPGKDCPHLTWEKTGGTPIPEPAMDWIPGAGSVENPYNVTAPDQLILIGKAGLLFDKRFLLGSDIDMSEIALSTAVIPEFSGVFDGNGLVIRNLAISGDHSLGMFGTLKEGSQVEALGIEDASVIGVANDIGILAGVNRGTVMNCYCSGSVSGHENVGVLIGTRTLSGNVMESHSSGMAAGKNRIGGLIGENRGDIEKCYSSCAVSGGVNVGGLIGYNDSGLIVGSYNTGMVDGNKYVGGIAGANHGDLAECYSEGIVEGGEDTGGLLGSNTGDISNCYSVSVVSGSEHTGGCIGANEGKAVDCYSMGSISGASYCGGFIGDNRNGTASNCYSTCLVSSSTSRYVGGFVGRKGSEVSCFWDMDRSGLTDSGGSGEGLSTVSMQSIEVYLDAGWDFVDETENGTDDIWWIDEGKDYPRLWWELTAEN